MTANPNGSRFQLLTNDEDWRVACTAVAGADGTFGKVHWDTSSGLTLQPLLNLFPAPSAERPLDPSHRRGAEADAYGNWYWIGTDQRSVQWLPRAGHPQLHWAPVRPEPCVPSGAFEPAVEDAPVESRLSGLAVTEHQYLVVGDLVATGLLVFDLRAGGEPVLIEFDERVAFQPFDICATPDGGFFVLDRVNRSLWRFDRDFRIQPLAGIEPSTLPVAPDAGAFAPLGGTPPVDRSTPAPIPLPLVATDPIAVTCVSNDEVLLLGREPEGSPSVLYDYRGGLLFNSYPLAVDVEQDDPYADEQTRHVAVSAYDAAYHTDDRTVYVVGDHGKQVVALVIDLDAAERGLEVQPTFLPLHYFGGRALSQYDGEMYYDVVAGDRTRDSRVRWVKVQDASEPRYYREAVLVTPVWDGKDRDCTWDRVFLDACIPVGADCRIASRASNEPELIGSLAFDEEPSLYLRAAGSEIPYYDPFADENPKKPATGTWETLLQGASGRYLQLRVTLTGNGRTTPAIRALRAYYPRYSYPRRYLPAVYQDDRASSSFLERFLANPEGFYTELEGKVRDVPLLFDARTSPPDTIEWLATWLGIFMDPIWEQLGQRRRAGSDQQYRTGLDRRRLLIRYALRLYARRGTPDGIRLALHLLLDPFLEECLDRFRRAATERNESLSAELSDLGISLPAPFMTDAQLEDLMLAYLLAPSRPSRIRIVEQFLTRGGRSAVEGDPGARQGALSDEVTGLAHRFSVLIPEDLSAPEAAMVSRLVDLEKPAHTVFDVRHYWEYFVVDQARTGIDTVLGDDRLFVPMVAGESYLAEGYLSADYPQEETDRVIVDRDGPFSMPPL